MSFGRLRDLTKTISFKLTAWFSAVFILSSIVLFGLAYFLLSSSIEEKDRSNLQLRLEAYSQEFESGGMTTFHRHIEADRKSGKITNNVVRLAAPDNTTLLLITPDTDARYDFTQLAEADRSDSGRSYLRAIGEDDVLEIVSRRLADGSLLQVGYEPEAREDVLDRFRNIFFAVLGGVVILGVVGGSLLSSQALRPVRGLIKALQPIIEAGKLKARVPVETTRDEVEELSALLNQALAKIDFVVESMRGSLDNVAHDLRTPMTRLRARAEMALAAEPPQDNCREALSDCLDECENMLTMLNTLMEISEVEAGSVRLDLAQVDVSSVIERIVELYRVAAEERNISILAVVTGELNVTADRNRLTQAIANLVDNAIKYTPPGGRVDVEAQRCESEVIVSIRDTGIGIPANETGKIWERSYRCDTSRAQRGLGLGLSVVKAVVQAHRGTVELSTTLGSGSCFKVHLPATSSQN